MPNSRFALHGLAPSLIHGLCAIFASDSRFVRLFQAPLDTGLNKPPLGQPLSSRFALHGLRAFKKMSENGFFETFRTLLETFFRLLRPEGPRTLSRLFRDFFKTFVGLARRLLLPGRGDPKGGVFAWNLCSARGLLNDF